MLNNPLAFIDPSGLIWGRKDGEDRYQWFDDEDAMKKAGYTAATQFLYEGKDEKFYAVNPSANEWKSFNNGYDASRTYWGYTGLAASWQDWVPVWGQFRQMLFNIATENYEGAMGNFILASAEGGTSGAGTKAAAGAGVEAAFATQPGKAVFWSGYPEAQAAAMQFAQTTGGKTIEMTLGGKALSLTNNLPFDNTRFWDWGSRHFAGGATDKTNVFLRSNYNPLGAWERVERPILQQHGVKITEHVVPK